MEIDPVRKVEKKSAENPAHGPRRMGAAASRAAGAGARPEGSRSAPPDGWSRAADPGRGARAEASTPRPRLGVGTMNLGGGNEEARLGFDGLRDRVAKEIVDGDLEVVTFQEMDVETGRTGGKDYNEEILGGVFEQDLGGSGLRQVGEFDPETNTAVYETTLPDGEVRQVRIRRESLDAQGNPVTDAQGRPEYDEASPIDVYTATYVDEDGQEKTYTMAYGSSISHDGGTFGNSVLLGPGQEIPRDGNGAIREGALVRHDLGANNPSGENKTALEVNFRSAETGETETALSTHFTSGQTDADKDARATQWETLDEIVGGRDVILGGDFNSQPGQEYRTGGWWVFGRESHRYPDAGDLGLQETAPGGEEIDRVLVGSGRVVDRKTVQGVEPNHDFQTFELEL